MADALDCNPEQEFSGGLKGLVFDVDGVMFDSRHSNIEYYNLIRRSVQLPPISAEDEEFCHMASVGEALERIIPPEYRDRALEACRTINYNERILPMLSVEPGWLEALHWLRQWNVGLLRYFGLEAFFSPVMTAGNSQPKPHPGGLLSIISQWGVEPRQIAFLGDSRVDEQAAKGAGVPFWSFRNDELTARLHFSDFFKMITWITPLVEGRQ